MFLAKKPTAKLLATLSLGLLLAACDQSYQRQVAQPYPVYSSTTTTTTRDLSLSERNCLDYGFASGSENYNRCVERDRRSRDQGRVSRDYDQGRLVEDARAACYEYGIERGSQRYENCVSREVDARRWRDQQGQTYVPAASYPPQPTYVDRRPAYEAQAGVPVMRDEFGFRYDGQGNRIDARGQIIDPSTTGR
jgi:hypothetical protein